MRVDKRQVFSLIVIAGIAGPFLFVPVVTVLGNLLSPSPLTAAQAHVPPLLGDAIWARALGGRATSLRPLEPVGVGRMIWCHVLAEQLDDPGERDRQDEECMKLMPAMQGAAYLSSDQMRRDGVWQTPRVPFIQIAMMNQVTNSWTRTQLVDTLAERAEFGKLFRGAEAAARGLFNRSTAELTPAQAALVAAMLGNARIDPWCAPARAAQQRRRILERMRDNGAIDEPTAQSANLAELGLVARPADHPPCAE